MERIAYTGSGLPYVDVTLTYHDQSISRPALVDSGSTLNVLPHDIGFELGLDWDAQTFPIEMEGVLRRVPAFAIQLTAQIGEFPSFQLHFAWLRRTSATLPIILGQMNFFQQFQVIFNGRSGFFELEQLV
ncbi:hypothetical protein CSA56_06085 [candidate division KSB3 bacterium]|uniref:Peptidase A2 domain-containing protein n=1 Tax=candidate division KSB3 bacterium TaxID=2044937 RepID=A0A2G6KH26_9BACT|nr:MAG: hypothetical protein CSA56_06085 [candidate division KSB3 bacterium]